MIDLKGRIADAKEVRKFISMQCQYPAEYSELYKIHLTIEEAQEIQDKLDAAED